MEQRPSTSIQRTEGQNNKLTGTLSFKERTCNRRSTIIEGVLSQEQYGKWKPIVFLSRTIQPMERNYEIYDKELLAIVEALSKWR